MVITPSTCDFVQGIDEHCRNAQAIGEGTAALAKERMKEPLYKDYAHYIES